MTTRRIPSFATRLYHETVGRLRRRRWYRRASLLLHTAWEKIVVPRHDGLPIPPPAMRQLTTLNILGVRRHVDDGIQVAREIEDAVLRQDIDPKSLAAVIEFGSGCGRVLRHLKPKWPDTRLYGTDIDRPMIEWCVRNLGGVAQFSVNGYAPPLGFDDRSADVIYLISVFTHLDESVQLEWLREFHRVLKPGGLLLLTIVQISDERLAEGPWDYVNDAGLAYGYRRREITKRSWVKTKTEHPHYIDAKHTLKYCQTAWSEWFSFAHAEPNANGGTQTLVTLRRVA